MKDWVSDICHRTDDMPIKPRSSSDPNAKAKASIMPMPTAKNNAVDTEEN